MLSGTQMAIVIEKVLSDTPQGVLVEALHDGERLTAEVVGAGARIEASIGCNLIVEMTVESVRSWRVVRPDVADHGLFAEPDDVVRIVGDVHNIIDVEGSQFLVDIYISAGPEFLLLKAEDLSGYRPDVSTRLELQVTGLAFYPSWRSQGPR